MNRLIKFEWENLTITGDAEMLVKMQGELPSVQGVPFPGA
jgi:hypothetical protein